MVLVTGSTGTGKSTTLAAMIDHLNSTRRLNIISLEDPVEFVHPSKQSQVIQRELGTHIPSFAEGVRAAMREDPDVILVGELRDAETISMAMTAAETGHLVLGTLHTTGAVKTIDRIIDALPVEQREQTKSFLAQSLLAVVTQVLVKTADGHGRKAICEVLMMTKAIAKLIQTDQTHQILSQLQMGRDRQGMLEQALLAWPSTRCTIDPDDAYNYASEKRAFQKYVTDTSMLPKLDITGTAQNPVAASKTTRPESRPPETDRRGANRLVSRRSAGQEGLRPALHRRRSAAHPPVRRHLRRSSPEKLAAEQVKQALYEIMPKAALERFESKDGADFAYTLPGHGRFRVNVMRQLNGIGAVFRAIPSKALTLRAELVFRRRCGPECPVPTPTTG